MKNWWFVLSRSVAVRRHVLGRVARRIHILTITMNTGLSVHTHHTGTINDSGAPSHNYMPI